MVEVTFIKSDFIPPGTKVNIDDYEGSIPDSEIPPLVNDEAPAAQLMAPPTAQTATSPSSLAVPTVASPLPLATPMAVAQLSVPAPSNGPSQLQPPPPLADTTNFLRIKLPCPRFASETGRVIRGEGFGLQVLAAHVPTIEDQKEMDESAKNEREVSVNSEDDEKTRIHLL
jgi:hypothetical protein